MLLYNDMQRDMFSFLRRQVYLKKRSLDLYFSL